ncbi:MAG: bifunctional folylpolyglutamate synthase/dihydrofolate synthase [Treponema sp.]|nr:MAG: bifunctional folylpolyglutamate synthase/dihydrofolate synthase [Treponema sp.]
MSTSQFELWLDGFLNCVKNPEKNIIRMSEYAKFFGNPHLAYRTIHVAGSKGKGSVTTMLASILREAGFTAGLYTSPHIVDFRERITMAGAFFDEKKYSSAYGKIISSFNAMLAEGVYFKPAWFEIVTMLAFLLFREENLDWGVFETGIGGRLDSTNIIAPCVCVLMPIELEHCGILGNSIEEIAFEKAGIIKPQVPVFCFTQQEAALQVFKEIADKKKAPFFYLPEIIDEFQFDISKEGGNITLKFSKNNPVGILFSRPIETTLPFFDEVQGMNACIAASVIKYLFHDIDETVIETGLKNASLQGRFEVIKNAPFVVLDGAHTMQSIQYCLKAYLSLVKRDDGILVFAAAKDKNTEMIAPLFSGKFSKIYLTIPGDFKASNLSKTTDDFNKHLIDSNTALSVSYNFDEVIKEAYIFSRNTNKPLLITGSFYLVGEAKKHINALL